MHGILSLCSVYYAVVRPSLDALGGFESLHGGCSNARMPSQRWPHRAVVLTEARLVTASPLALISGRNACYLGARCPFRQYNPGLLHASGLRCRNGRTARVLLGAGSRRVWAGGVSSEALSSFHGYWNLCLDKHVTGRPDEHTSSNPPSRRTSPPPRYRVGHRQPQQSSSEDVALPRRKTLPSCM
jgi:hypothetical protein